MSVSHPALLVAPEQPLPPERVRATTALRPRPSESRSRIIEAAERLFRHFGHQKTTVADIARALSMSPANIYRFFSSKEAINNAVCRRLLGNLTSVPAELAQYKGTAKDSLRALVLELARINAERCRMDEPLHQLLAAASRENWPAVTDYVERIETTMAAIIGEGARRGEFHDRDARRASRCIYSAVVRHVHPGLIVCDGPGQPSLSEMVDFCLAALN